MTTTWPGEWVAERLGADLRTTQALPGLDLHDLVGLAVRRNPRRAHLLVSNVLGKHVPVDPQIVRGSGRALGELVRRVLDAGAAVGSSDAGSDDSGAQGHDVVDGALARVGQALHEALRAPDDARVVDEFTCAVDSFVDLQHSPACVVMGFAETATALGQCVADTLRAPAIH